MFLYCLFIVSNFYVLFLVSRSLQRIAQGWYCTWVNACPRDYLNVDDTDSEDDTHDYEAATPSSNGWMDEWNSYLNANEDMPDGMGIVRWWGVYTSI